MKTFVDILKEDGRIEGERQGRIEGRIKGKIKTIQTVASLRFSESPRRLTTQLKKLDDLKLLEQIRQFALTAPTLSDVENFVKSLAPTKPRVRRVAKSQAA